jgi:hypothetical protein
MGGWRTSARMIVSRSLGAEASMALTSRAWREDALVLRSRPRSPAGAELAIEAERGVNFDDRGVISSVRLRLCDIDRLT